MLIKSKINFSTNFNISVVVKRHIDNKLVHCEAQRNTYMADTINISMPSIAVISR